MKRILILVNDYSQLQGVNSVTDQFIINRNMFHEKGIEILGVCDCRGFYHIIPKRKVEITNIRKTIKYGLKKTFLYKTFLGEFVAGVLQYLDRGYNAFKSGKKVGLDKIDYIISEDYYASLFLTHSRYKEKLIHMTHMYEEQWAMFFVSYPKLKGTFAETMINSLTQHVNRKAKKIVTICNVANRRISELRDTGTIYTIYNSASISEIDTKPGSNTVLRAAITCSITEKKGMDIFLDYIEKKNDLPFLFQIYGDGSFMPKIKESIKKNRIKNVIINGQVPEPWRQYAEIDVLILLSKSESLPMSIIEALGCGLPVIATDVGAVNEMIEDGYNGFLIRPNLDSFYNGLRTVYDNKSLLRVLGENAKKSYNQNFSPEIWVENFCKVFDE